jgi:Protein of unknown function (DUF2569)
MEEYLGSDWLIVGGIIFAVIAAIVISIIISERRGDTIKGIGGWLLVPILIFICVPALKLYLIIANYTGDNFPALVNIFSVDKTDPLAFLRLPILGEFFFFALVTGACIFCLICVWKKKKAFKTAAVLTFAIIFASAAFEYWAAGVVTYVRNLLGETTEDTSRFPAFGSYLFWLVYLFQSRRVRNTFVN